MRRLSLLLLAGCASTAPLPAVLPPHWAGAEAPELWARTGGEIRGALDVCARHNLRAVRIVIRESFGECKDVEGPLGTWHDEILERIDVVLREAAARGVRVIVVLHDGRNRADEYAKSYPDAFYTDTGARAAFRRRIKHILEHRNWGSQGHVTWEVQAHSDWRKAIDWTEDMANYVKMIAGSAKTAASIDFVTFGGLTAQLLESSPSVDLWTYAPSSQEPLADAAVALSKKLKPQKKEWILVEAGSLRSNPQRGRTTLEAAIAVARRHEVPWLFASLGHDTHEASTDQWPGDVIFDSVIAPAAKR